jgi:flagellar biosynthesis/type III secretory pathway protein FliH
MNSGFPPEIKIQLDAMYAEASATLADYNAQYKAYLESPAEQHTPELWSTIHALLYKSQRQFWDYRKEYRRAARERLKQFFQKGKQ